MLSSPQFYIIPIANCHGCPDIDFNIKFTMYFQVQEFSKSSRKGMPLLSASS